MKKPLVFVTNAPCAAMSVKRILLHQIHQGIPTLRNKQKAKPKIAFLTAWLYNSSDLIL